MKKIYLIKTLLLLFALVAGSGSVWAEEEVYYTLDGTPTNAGGNSNYAEAGDDVVENGMNWSVTGNTTINPWRIGGKSLSGINREAYSKTPMGDAITKVELEIGNITLSKVNSITLIVASDASFKSVIQTIGKTSGISANTTLTFTPSSSNWATGAYYKFVFNVDAGSSNQYIQLKSAKFYHLATGVETVATPSFDPISGTYTTAQSITISCATEDADIYYTTNGNDPSTESTKYTEAISVTNTTTIKAIAVMEGMNNSAVATANYTIKPSQPNISATGSTVTITGGEGCTFYYTIDSTDPTNSSTQYRGPFELTQSCTIKAKAYDNYGNASDVRSLQFKYFPLNPKNINSGYFEKVTDVSTLENGDAILIVNEENQQAMSTTQNNNNRGQAAIVTNNNVIYAPSADVQKIVLVKQTEKIDNNDTDVFYFYTGSNGYLYAASNSSNHLKTEATPDDNGNARATITISSNGIITVKFTGKNSRNIMQYNSSSEIFACYGTASQAPVHIYKEVAHNETATVGAKGFATFVSDYALDFTGKSISAYTINSTDGSKLTLTKKDQVAAGDPVLLYSETDSDSQNIPVIESATADANNKLVRGTGAAITWSETSKVYVLNTENTPAFYCANNSPVATNKAYLDLTGVTGVGGNARSFTLDLGEATGIDEIVNSKSSNGAWYDLQGRRVVKAQKGLYIVDGKKVIKK